VEKYDDKTVVWARSHGVQTHGSIWEKESLQGGALSAPV
jgi:hypothetical protein